MKIPNEKILFVCGHPTPEESQYQNILIEKAESLGIKCNVLSKSVKNGNFDIKHEQELLINAQRIIFSFPLFWYSFPSIMKKWMEDVFIPGFAYASGGDKLSGKDFMVVTTVGAPKEAYRAAGFNNYNLDELLRCVEQSIKYVGGNYLPPYAVYKSIFLDEKTRMQECESIMHHVTKEFYTKKHLYKKMIDEAEELQVSLALQAYKNDSCS